MKRSSLDEFQFRRSDGIDRYCFSQNQYFEVVFALMAKSLFKLKRIKIL